METLQNYSYKETDKVGNTFYYNSNGKLHRTDGPAIEWADGSKRWYQNGLLHRTDGPAIERINGSKEWYLNGLRHRTNGPAVEWSKWSNGTKNYWIHGFKHTEEEFFEIIKYL